MGKKNLVSINDFSRDEILKIMEMCIRDSGHRAAVR